MRSGEILKKADITRDTLRHYTDIKLIAPRAREANGYTVYSHADLEDIVFIRNAKMIGFSLEEIREILKHMRSSRCRHQSLLPYLHEQLEKIDTKIRSLKKIKNHLRFLIKDYETKNCAVKPSELKL